MGNQSGDKTLPFFKQTEIIHDFTAEFVEKYIEKFSRTRDQMVQAARSGKQNIPEGYLQKSLKGRIKLLGVSRGSLEELLNDYLDFLRQHNLTIWEKDHPQAKKIRALVYNRYNNYKNYKFAHFAYKYVFANLHERSEYKIYINSPENAANCMVCLINQTNRLIDQKLRWLEEKFAEEGGYTENLFKKRLANR